MAARVFRVCSLVWRNGERVGAGLSARKSFASALSRLSPIRSSAGRTGSQRRALNLPVRLPTSKF